MAIPDRERTRHNWEVLIAYGVPYQVIRQVIYNESLNMRENEEMTPSENIN